MAKKQHSERILKRVTEESLRTLIRLIPVFPLESSTARSDKLAQAVLQKFFGPEWMELHVTGPKAGFLGIKNEPPALRETRRMRRIMLAEMLFNLQHMKGFRSCLANMADGQIESTYATFEMVRMLAALALDEGLKIRFVTPSGIKRRDYDLSLTFSDGVRACAETKCKQEETDITIRTIEESLSKAKKQMPQGTPGIIFVKVPRSWLDDEKFVEEMRKLAQRFLDRSRSVVSVKYYTAQIIYDVDAAGETISELIAFDERTNENHKFRKHKGRNWHMFPTTIGPPPQPRANFNGMPSKWRRLLIQ